MENKLYRQRPATDKPEKDGWYIVECNGTYTHMLFDKGEWVPDFKYDNPESWLEPYTVPVDVEQVAENKKGSVYNTIKPISNDKLLPEYSKLRHPDESRDKEYSPLQDLFMREIASHLKLYTTPEVFEKAWTASLFPERLTKACLRATEQYIDSLPSRPSFNPEEFIKKLREENPYDKPADSDWWIWELCCDKAAELLKTKEEK